MEVIFKPFTAPFPPAISNLLKLAVGKPTPQKIITVLQMYCQPNHYLLTSLLEEEIIALIGVALNKDITIIHHIAVEPKHQHQGIIGRALIHEITQQLSPKQIMAETDQETVEFYKKLGFSIEPFQGPNGQRFRCQLTLLR